MNAVEKYQRFTQNNPKLKKIPEQVFFNIFSEKVLSEKKARLDHEVVE
jgi:hypothetical protein